MHAGSLTDNARTGEDELKNILCLCRFDIVCLLLAKSCALCAWSTITAHPNVKKNMIMRAYKHF